MTDFTSSPRGALRTLFDPTAEDAHATALFDVLQRVATEHQLDPAVMVTALELADLEPGLTPPARTALTVLVAASLLSLQEGSTRIDLRLDPDPDSDLQRKLGLVHQLAAEVLPPHHALLPELEPSALIPRLGPLLRGGAPVVIGLPGEFKPLLVTADHLYHQRVLLCEVELGDLLRARLHRAAPVARNPLVAEALHAVLADLPRTAGGRPLELTPEQQFAVLSVLHRPLTVISGGPGTGKTSTVVSILRTALRAGFDPADIVLAAPTGKAAHRMGTAIAEHLEALSDRAPADQRLRERLGEPQTIHRLLGYAPQLRRYRFHRHNPLTARLVVIDEASMIDLFLMTRLLGAVPIDARLVLIGDADQLPSVETGAVFRDLLPRRVDTSAPWAADVLGEPLDLSRSDEPTARSAIRLLRSFRMRQTDPAGRNVLQVAQWINTGGILGELFGDYGLMRPVPRPDLLAWSGVEKLADTAGLGPFLATWFERWLDPRAEGHPLLLDAGPLLYRDGAFEPASHAILDALFARYALARLLALTRVLPTGADNFNRALHARWLDAAGLPPSTELAHGEPVMMVRNDYDLGLFNGDQGIVVRVGSQPDDPRGSLRVAFPGRTAFRLFDLHRVAAHLELAYAMTVHKSQGSEFQHVGLVLPHRDMSILSREILYTAITRASRSVCILGQEELVLRAAQRVLRRSSGLRARLDGTGEAASG